YINYLSDCIRLLNTGGILICDDVLFYEMIAKVRLRNKGQTTIVKRMRRFLKAVSNHQWLDTTIIPIGHGVSLSVKKRPDSSL
ncbi:MAG TPA: O-methyltransferase, partial [Bacillota bacterium]|nr:O-methyltransferase [Bacillota bacterium]